VHMVRKELRLAQAWLRAELNQRQLGEHSQADAATGS
jgi:hypothetical protein